MTEAKSTQPQHEKDCGCAGEFHDAGCKCTCTDHRKDALCQVHAKSLESIQPQLPLRPETYIDRTVERIKPGEDAVAVRYMDALEAENESLKAERDNLLEVVREYRESKANHAEDCEDYSKWDRRQFPHMTHFEDERCPTCIKADALLSREPKEEAC